MKKNIVHLIVVVTCFFNIAAFAQTIEKKIANENVKPPSGYKGKRVAYDLNIADTMVNYTGKKRMAIAVNGSIPAPHL